MAEHEARAGGIPASGDNLQPYDACNADEALLATTFYCMLPVGRIDNRPLGREVPGPIPPGACWQPGVRWWGSI